MEGWKYYNHALIPDCAPHVEPNVDQIKKVKNWKFFEGTPLLARWTTDFDCGYETEWWYVIKDSMFCVDDLPASSRKHIRQALKKCRVDRINAKEYAKELYECYQNACKRYENQDNFMDEESFARTVMENEQFDYWAGFDLCDGRLIGYMKILDHGEWIEMLSAKYAADALNLRVSDAIHYTVLENYLNRENVNYICAGSRNINHKTNAQEYKIDNFGFRKAYCKLRVKYRPCVRVLVKCIYPFRKVLFKLDKSSFVHQINGVLKMEEVIRNTYE